MSVNARGTFLTTRAFIPVFVAQGGGRIINMSSIIGQHGVAFVLPYVCSKFAVTGMTQSLAAELAPHGITVNSVHPGIVETDLHAAVTAGFGRLVSQDQGADGQAYGVRVPLGRFQTPRDVAEVTAFLASDRAANITGSAFNVDGGLALH